MSRRVASEVLSALARSSRASTSSRRTRYAHPIRAAGRDREVLVVALEHASLRAGEELASLGRALMLLRSEIGAPLRALLVVDQQARTAAGAGEGGVAPTGAQIAR
jgi:hypothetical protein